MDFGVREGAGNPALVQPVRVDRRADEFPAAIGLVQRISFFVVLGITVERGLFQSTQVKGREYPVRGVRIEHHTALRLVSRGQFGVSDGGLG
ncbi:hypothetical protein D3C86_1861510 [compost metagenome]